MALASEAPIRAHADPGITLPNSLIIGAAKSGTGRTVRFTADPTFVPSPDPARRSEAGAGLTRIGIDLEKRIVAICPRTLITGLWHPFSPRAIEDLIAEMADLTGRLLEAGVQVVLVQMSPDQPDDDAVVIDEIMARVDPVRGAPAVLPWNPRLPRLMVGVFEHVDAVVAVRLHGAILAMLAGKPAMTIGYEPKVRGIMDAVGLADNVLPVEGFDGRQCAAVVLDWLENPDEIKGTVGLRIERIRAKAYENLTEAVRLIAPEQRFEQRGDRRWAG